MTVQPYINSLKKAPKQPNRNLLLGYIKDYLKRMGPIVEEYRKKLDKVPSEDIKKIMAEIIKDYEEVEKFYMEVTNDLS